ncbi:YncE family protein, partial [Rhodoblastus sp.]|uniref:YncE family protein n=3 Tax=Rhodoblastus sp. TaxID=1962975 RepID=UPI003F9BEDFF
MAGERAKLETILGRLRRTLRIGLAAAALTAATCGAAAQGARPGVTAIGDAAVTGFSGAPAPDRIAPGEDAAAQTFIDRDGPSLRIVDLRRMGGPPEAQLVGAPKIFTVRAARIGQVFGVAFDDSNPPNVYVAASSAYGLPIVAPKSGGGLIHIRLGAAGAVFMPGLWGPNGGPGAIWRLDGATGEVRLFAMVATDGRANSGAALGGLAFDSASKMLFVADRETGLIHRISGAGADLGTYDHGVTGRAALGLAPAPWRAPPPLDVAKSAFDSAQPATWGYAGPQRLIFGLAVHDRRLYYAVVDGLQVWSVGLGPDGAFGSDARLEIAAPPSNGPTEISKIAFDAEGRIYLAERAAPTGAFDFEALAQPAIGRVLRYAIVGQTADGQRIWQQTPDAYAIGFPEIFRNGNGGVAIGYGYLETGAANRGSCDGFLWTTGEQLRVSADAKIAARLARGGESHIDGLQGNPLWRILRDREPPFVSYFISYADNFADPSTRGHMGDIDIRRLCEPGPAPSFGRPDLPPPRPLPPDMPPPKHRPVPPQGKPPTPPSNTPPVCKPWQICGPPGTPPCPPNQIWRRDTNSCAPTCPRPNVLIA